MAERADVGGVLLFNADNPKAFFDALAVSPVAYRRHMPMLGIRRGAIPAGVGRLLDHELDGKLGYIVSGAYCGMHFTPESDSPLARSADRFEAACDIADASLKLGWVERRSFDVGVSATLSDALGGDAFMGHEGGVLLYTTSTSAMQPTTSAWIDARHNGIPNGWIFGGTTSFPSAQQTQYRALLK